MIIIFFSACNCGFQLHFHLITWLLETRMMQLLCVSEIWMECSNCYMCKWSEFFLSSFWYKSFEMKALSAYCAIRQTLHKLYCGLVDFLTTACCQSWSSLFMLIDWISKWPEKGSSSTSGTILCSSGCLKFQLGSCPSGWALFSVNPQSCGCRYPVLDLLSKVYLIK